MNQPIDHASHCALGSQDRDDIDSSTPKAFNTIAQGTALREMEMKTQGALQGRQWECFAEDVSPLQGWYARDGTLVTQGVALG